MKKVLYVLAVSLIVLGYSCKPEKEDTEPIYSVSVKLVYPDKEPSAKDVKIVLTNKTNSNKAEAVTDQNGMAKFRLTPDVYEVKVSEERSKDAETFLYEIVKEITIDANWQESKIITLELSKTDISKKYDVKVKLVYPESIKPAKDVDVLLVRKATNKKSEAKTDDMGIAQFNVIAGSYELSIYEKRMVDNKTLVFTGKNEFTIDDSWNANQAVQLELLKTDSTVYKANIKLVYPTAESAKKDVEIIIIKDKDTLKVKTDETGLTNFEGLAGNYDVKVEDPRMKKNGTSDVFSGSKTINITSQWKESEVINIDLTKKNVKQILTKELFTGGTPKDDGSGYFGYDRYIILYNNSAYPTNITDIALATTMPYNSSGSNKYLVSGSLTYEAQGWMPAGQAVWHFNREVEVAPYKQVVIAITNAVDNTPTYSKSINFANSEYFCTYDPQVFNHKRTYVAPSEKIPTTNYLSALRFGKGTAWTLSMPSPGFFIFSTQDVTLKDFVADASTSDKTYTSSDAKKVPRTWIVDGVEAFWYGKTNNKRFTADIDAGFVNYTTKLGYSIYRNVDKEATEAIEGNKAKLVYNYAQGTQDIAGGTTDPSGIDAEASIKKGAIIIYLDKNNSTKDFHQRKKASLRTN